jgi:hypothetical protein
MVLVKYSRRGIKRVWIYRYLLMLPLRVVWMIATLLKQWVKDSIFESIKGAHR